MAERERMQWGARAVVAVCGIAWALGAACGGGGGGGTTIQFLPVFPQGYLPVSFAGADGPGDVAIRSQGNLYAVVGTADVSVVSRDDGSVSVFSADVGGAGSELLSVVVASDGGLFVGDADGIVYRIDAEGVSSLLLDTGSGPITGLAVAPGGFGDAGGSLFAAAGAAGLRRITTGEMPEVSDLEPTRSYVDLVFSGTTLFALDAGAGELVTVDGAGTPTFFQGGFDAPVGLGLDSGRQELLVADAGDRTLYAVPVAGGTPQPRAPYVYDTTPPSGIAYDDIGALAWVTSGSVVIRGSAVPRIDVDNTSFGSIIGNARAGYGDLELARDGSFLLVANDPDDDPASETDSVGNFLISVARDHSVANVLSSAIGIPGELLLSLAHDAFTETSYIGTADGNVYRRASDGTVDLLAAASSDAVLGLEIAPAGFGAFGGHLVATTERGDVFAIDPAAPVRVDIVSEILTTSGMPAPLSDLVFALDGTLYVLDNASTADPGDPRVLVVAPDGDFEDLVADPGRLGQADGIEIDEGGERLLVVVSDDEGGDQLVAVSLEPATLGEVTPLADLSNVDDGYFPTGVVYDRLGSAVVREGDAFTQLGAYSVLP